MYSPCESIPCLQRSDRAWILRSQKSAGWRSKPGQSRFEVIEVSEALAAQVVLEGAEEVEFGRRQVGGLWWVGYSSPAQLFQLLAGGRSNGIVVQQADFRPSSPLFLDGGGEPAQLAGVDVGYSHGEYVVE